MGVLKRWAERKPDIIVRRPRTGTISWDMFADFEKKSETVKSSVNRLYGANKLDFFFYLNVAI